MAVEFIDLDCNIFGSFKNGDNARYNAVLLSDLVAANEDGRFNKLIVLQVASIVEVCTIQLFYRAQRFNREGVPNITEADRRAIADRQIDKFAVIIDNLRKYEILNGLGAEIYDELHKLRKYRNKVHIQLDVGIYGVSRDERDQFTDALASWAISINWNVLSYLEEHYSRPAHIRGHVQPLRLPRLIQ